MYVEEPGRLLRRVAAHLRPGGIVAFQESENLKAAVQTYPPTPTHDEIMRWMNPPVDPPMPVFDMGLRLYRTFIDGGLDAPELRQDTPIGGGVEWPGYALVAESVRSLLPFMEQIGTVTAEEADVDTLEARLRNEALAHDAVQVLPTVIGAWTRTALSTVRRGIAYLGTPPSARLTERVRCRMCIRDIVDRVDERPYEPLWVTNHCEVVAAHEMRHRAGHAGRELELATRRNDLIPRVHEYRRRYVDLPHPIRGGISPERDGGLQHGAWIAPTSPLALPTRNTRCRRNTTARSAAMTRRAAASGSTPLDVLECGKRGEHRMLPRRLAESVARRAHDETGDALGVATPHELSDRSAHRVADRQKPFDVQRVRECDDVVGGSFERERRVGANAAAVTAMVRRDDSISVFEGRKRGEPIQRRGRAEAMQQHHDVCIGRAPGVAHEHRAAAGQGHRPSGRQWWHVEPDATNGSVGV